jgi:major membrane immunogen (membrane-anchored lipoprotein)
MGVRKFVVLGAVLLSTVLASCGQETVSKARVEEGTFNVEVETAEAVAGAEAAADSEPPPPDNAITIGTKPDAETQRLPQIAYSYSLSYETETGSVGGLQKSHATLCEKAGQEKCHILSMAQSDAQASYGTAELKLEVRADYAREFIDSLGKAAADIDATQTDSAIEGEDLSKEIVDTEARLASRKLLRDRLMNILATKSGTVQELVEAERAVANVTEEIEVAESRLADMKGRVRFSALTIDYESESMNEGSFWNPISDALSGFAAVLGTVIGGIINFVAFFLPIILFLSAIIWLVRMLRRRGFLHFGIRRRWRQFLGKPEPVAD